MEASKVGKTPLPEESQLDRFSPSDDGPNRVLQFELGRREFVQFLGALAAIGLIDGLDVLDVSTAFALESGKKLFDPISAQPSGVGPNQSANNAVRKTVTVQINHTKGQRWYISGSADRVSTGQVDDALRVSVLETVRTNLFEYYTAPHIFEITGLLREGGNNVRVDLIDKIGPHWGCSALWLVGTGTDGGGGGDDGGSGGRVCHIGFKETVTLLHVPYRVTAGPFCVDLKVNYTVQVSPCGNSVVDVDFANDKRTLEIKSDQGVVRINDKGFIEAGGSGWQPTPSSPKLVSETSTEGVFEFKFVWSPVQRLDAGIFLVSLDLDHTYRSQVCKPKVPPVRFEAAKYIVAALAIIFLAAFLWELALALAALGVVEGATAIFASLMLILRQYVAGGGTFFK